MTSYGTTNSYVYRADRMRVSKLVGSTATSYAYDGQMGMEDVDTTSGLSTVTDYGLGARGVDYISSTKSGTTTVGFPVYDAHGNMTACLFRSGSNYYCLGNQRHYDAWGAIRSGAGAGDPKGRYCASLGHKQDDESGLVYMRARYFEPSSGRFLNEDQRRIGSNWLIYSCDDPVNHFDGRGHLMLGLIDLFAFIFGALSGLAFLADEGTIILSLRIAGTTYFGAAIGGFTPVTGALIAAAAVLTVVGAILTVDATVAMFKEVMSGSHDVAEGTADKLVTEMKLAGGGFAKFGAELELAYAIGESNSGQDD